MLYHGLSVLLTGPRLSHARQASCRLSHTPSPHTSLPILYSKWHPCMSFRVWLDDGAPAWNVQGPWCWMPRAEESHSECLLGPITAVLLNPVLHRPPPNLEHFSYCFLAHHGLHQRQHRVSSLRAANTAVTPAAAALLPMYLSWGGEQHRS